MAGLESTDSTFGGRGCTIDSTDSTFDSSGRSSGPSATYNDRQGCYRCGNSSSSLSYYCAHTTETLSGNDYS